MMLIKAGALLILETAEYSDYTFHGPLRVVKDFDQADAANDFRAQWVAPNEWDDEPSTDQFIGWLTRQGYVEPIDGVVSWPIGSYGRFKPEISPEPIAV